MNDFVKLFCKDLVGPRILSIMNATVSRILKEQNAKQSGMQTDSSSIVLDKCCTILRICVENNTYMMNCQDQAEEELKRIFVYIQEPTQISFEDDILLLIKSLIKRRKAVVPFMWEMFDHFPKIVAKAKGQMGDLLDTINYFVLYGKEDFAQRENAIRVYAQIIQQAIQTKRIISDCEGAVACQLLFQSLAGTTSLNPFIDELLEFTKKRMADDPMPIDLKKHMLGIFMSAMYYNSTLTLHYMERSGMTAQLVEEMLNIREQFNAEYERRFFIVGLSKMLMSPQLPPSLQP